MRHYNAYKCESNNIVTKLFACTISDSQVEQRSSLVGICFEIMFFWFGGSDDSKHVQKFIYHVLLTQSFLEVQQKGLSFFGQT